MRFFGFLASALVAAACTDGSLVDVAAPPAESSLSSVAIPDAPSPGVVGGVILDPARALPRPEYPVHVVAPTEAPRLTCAQRCEGAMDFAYGACLPEATHDPSMGSPCRALGQLTQGVCEAGTCGLPQPVDLTSLDSAQCHFECVDLGHSAHTACLGAWSSRADCHLLDTWTWAACVETRCLTGVPTEIPCAQRCDNLGLAEYVQCLADLGDPKYALVCRQRSDDVVAQCATACF